MFYRYHNHGQLVKGKSTKSLNDQELISVSVSAILAL